MEELNTALATLIEQATTGIDASVGFLQAELPDVVTQLLMWHGVKSGLYCLLALLILAAWGCVEVVVIKMGKKEKWDSEDWIFVYGMFGTIPRLLPFLIVMIFFNTTWLQIWIAPKVWLLEYAAKLVS